MEWEVHHEVEGEVHHEVEGKCIMNKWKESAS
jgi:hypothetical protein